MISKLVLTYAALLYGIFGAGWLIAPDALGKFWAIARVTNRPPGSARSGVP